MSTELKTDYAHSKLTCVILCGGTGSRLLPLSLEQQKGMIEVNGKPILSYIIDYWRKYTSDFIFIVKYKKEGIINYVKSLDIKSRFIEPVELKGIADAISYVEPMVSDNFIIVLGDCICKGEFVMPANMQMGVGVWKTKNPNHIKRSYSIELQENMVSRVVEKPKVLPNDYCGMGFYFFNKIVFKYVKNAKPSMLRNEKEITDVIQNMINGGEAVSPIFFNGEYLNVTVKEDLKIAKRILN